ncbi:Uncharacterised protein [uncultured archaeon]|nr:Uncharacterised protein [uncultured archaeon]
MIVRFAIMVIARTKMRMKFQKNGYIQIGSFGESLLLQIVDILKPDCCDIKFYFCIGCEKYGSVLDSNVKLV